MKQHALFTIFALAAVLCGCKEPKYECMASVVWSDSEAKMRGKGDDVDNKSKANTIDAALLETLSLVKRKFPKATEDDIYIVCRGDGEIGKYGRNPCYYDNSGFLVCDKKNKSKKIKNTEFRENKPTPVREIRFGCRAWTQTPRGSRNSLWQSYYARTHDEAVAKIRAEYSSDHPRVANFESNCWSCDQVNLEKKAAELCN